MMWLEMEQVDESIFVQAIVPALRALNDGLAHNIARALNISTQTKGLHGCHTVENLEKWAAPKLKSE